MDFEKKYFLKSKFLKKPPPLFKKKSFSIFSKKKKKKEQRHHPISSPFFLMERSSNMSQKFEIVDPPPSPDTPILIKTFFVIHSGSKVKTRNYHWHPPCWWCFCSVDDKAGGVPKASFPPGAKGNEIIEHLVRLVVNSFYSDEEIVVVAQANAFDWTQSVYHFHIWFTSIFAGSHYPKVWS
jgi:hypothetical protein